MKSLTNFRDLGGLCAANGQTVAPCRLLRCGEPVNVCEADKAALTQQYCLRNIVDLRSVQEAQASPDDTFTNVQYHHIDILANDENTTASRDALLSEEALAQTGPYMQHLYQHMVEDDTASAGYRRFIDILLAQTEGAALFHCFAGKDRTGLAAAIILTILGVSREDIFADYLQSNEQRRACNALMLEQARAAGLSEKALEALGVALGVQAEYLEASYAAAEKKYGSFAAYIENGVGVTPSEQARLQELYLV